MKLKGTYFSILISTGTGCIFGYFFIPAISVVASPVNMPTWLFYVGIAFLVIPGLFVIGEQVDWSN